MANDSKPSIGRRGVLKATGGLASVAALGTGQVAANSENTIHNHHGNNNSYQDCFDSCRPITREERRLFITIDDEDENPDANEDKETPVAQRILEQSGFDKLVTEFMKELCDVQSSNEAEEIVKNYGENLWETAVARAQGDQPSNLGDSEYSLHPYDSRPLYWARLKMAAAIRQWDPDFRVSNGAEGDLYAPPQQLDPNYGSPQEDREGLVNHLEYTSRGLTSTEFTDDNATRLIVSGFDTFGLDADIRTINPSAVTALQLDGKQVHTDLGKVHIETVIFPVRWADFDEGIVEDAFGPHLIEGGNEHKADLLMTISQGGPANPEQFAANWRGGQYANNHETREGYVPPAPSWKQPEERVDWIETTLPIDEMVAVEKGPNDVVFDPTVTGWEESNECPDPRLVPVINQQLVTREGSVEGMLPYAGGGGNYLSNESMFRSNRLRLGLGLDDFPGGHLHIGAINFAEDNTSGITGSNFEKEMKARADEIVAIVIAAGKAVS